MKRFWPPLLLSTTVLCLLVWGFLGLSSIHTARLVIENQSGEDIPSLTVEVSGQLFSLGFLASGSTKEVIVSRYNDSHWTLDGAWSTSEKIHEEFGYITHGMSFDDHAVFEKGRRLNFKSPPN